MEKPGPATESGGAGALVDLLSPFLGTVGLGDSLSENGDISVRRNFFFGPAQGWRGSIGGTLQADPEIFAPLKTNLEENLGDAAADQISSLESEIGDYQNLDFDFQLSFEGDWLGRQWGRNPEQYDTLAASVFRSAVDATVDSSGLRALSKALTDRPQLMGQIAGMKVKKLRVNVDPEDLAAIQAAFNDAVTMESKNLAALGPEAKKRSELLAALVANQPQIFLGVTYKDREDEVVGPDSIEATFKFEFGASGNVNDLRTWWEGKPGGCPESTLVNGVPELAASCLQTYLEETKKNPAKGNRFSFTATYTEIDAFELEIAERDFSFSTPETERITAALSYGRWLSGIGLGASDQRDGKARFDLETSWEEFDEEQVRQDRFVATATLSQRTTACTVLSFGLAYANKPEFLGEVDEELSARLGLRWDSQRSKKCKGGSG